MYTQTQHAHVYFKNVLSNSFLYVWLLNRRSFDAFLFSSVAVAIPKGHHKWLASTLIYSYLCRSIKHANFVIAFAPLEQRLPTFYTTRTDDVYNNPLFVSCNEAMRPLYIKKWSRYESESLRSLFVMRHALLDHNTAWESYVGYTQSENHACIWINSNKWTFTLVQSMRVFLLSSSLLVHLLKITYLIDCNKFLLGCMYKSIFVFCLDLIHWL